MPANRSQLKNVLQKPYDRLLLAKEVLKPIFNDGFNFFDSLIPSEHEVTNSEAKVVNEVNIYGRIILEDGTEITCYEIKLQPKVRIEKSKILIQQYVRKLLTAGQAALINFISPSDGNVWRLTLVAKDSILTEEGIKEKFTEAKRYTYLVGPAENCRTVSERLETLSIEKSLNFESLVKAFSVEKLNKDFYKDISEQFYRLIGATVGKGKNVKVYERQLQLPVNGTEASRTFQEFAVRLIGRTVFCWFLKVKKSDAGVALLPEHLLSSNAVKNNPNYYHNILERLFFQTLNTPIDKRILNLPKGSDLIPFLNGGLFEAQSDDYYKPNPSTGLSFNNASVSIPDEWFVDFFEKLEQYNFTIDENSVLDVEISVDPEMLGSIFENLLAEIDPDSGETARKATGSFYTPRQIVEYMATESLIYYLKNTTSLDSSKLTSLFNIDDLNLSATEKEEVLIALDNVKILDPACGSGAFPMGILQKIVLALQKLDKNADWWIEKQVVKYGEYSSQIAFREKLQKNADYARKIGIIQNSLYGVDIQPIAAEISKLRCFLTLIVDEQIDENKPNRGIEPLPNLEFKFVTADTLLKLPEDTNQVPMYNSKKRKNPLELLADLQNVRFNYLQSYGEEKLELKKEFQNIQKDLFDQQGFFGHVENNRAFKIANWRPFDHGKTDWFDSEWMFGVKGFNIVIGNPPYVDIKNLPKDCVKFYFKNYETTENRINLYSIFIERGLTLLDENGILAFINPNSILVNESYKKIRKRILQQVEKIIKLPDSIFKEAIVETILLFISSKPDTGRILGKYFRRNDEMNFNQLEFKEFSKSSWKEDPDVRFNIFSDSITYNLLTKIESNKSKLSNLVEFSLGITPYDSYKGHTKELIESRAFHSDTKSSPEYVPLISGKNINPYFISEDVKEYLKYGNWLGAAREQKFFEQPKIIVRQILSGPDLRIIAGYSESPHYFTQIGFSLISKTQDINLLKHLTAILNSKLMSYYHKEKYLDKEKTVFQKILIANCKLFPIHIPMCLELAFLVDSIRKQISQKESASVKLIEKKIDLIVYKLYDLTFEEAKIIDPSIDKLAFEGTYLN